MRLVHQTRFGYPDGNCLAACVASLLELTLPEVWDPGPLDPTWKDNSKWWKGWFDWLAQRNLRFVFHRTVPDGNAIALGMTTAGTRHAVVVLGGQLVWDPHEHGPRIIRTERWLTIERVMTSAEKGELS